jgi:hypothetical protein
MKTSQPEPSLAFVYSSEWRAPMPLAVEMERIWPSSAAPETERRIVRAQG